jgi:hypothetical protein
MSAFAENTGRNFKELLAALREVGWSDWDPIGLADLGDRPEDEYDSYLLTAAARLANGASEERVTDYLVDIEIRHMGLSEPPGVRNRAAKVVRRIAAIIHSQQ